MNRKLVLSTIGQITMLEALMLVLPLLVSFLYSDGCWLYFLLTGLIALGIGLPLWLCFRHSGHEYFAKEGFVTTGLAWLILSAIGALPFFLSRQIPSYVDAFFETVSGFTTTGASILDDVEFMSRSLLFWRSFTHWVGGMGVLVLLVAVLPTVSGRTIHVLRAEMPGPTMGKLVPKIKDTAKILYLIYIGMTVAEILLLVIGGMPLFDSIVHSFGSAGTGGFGIKNNSIAGYSHYCQWVITVFMFLFGVNFNLYFMILIGRIKPALLSDELRAYVLFALAAALFIGINIYPMYHNVADTVRLSAFQVSSIMTTTGYSTVNFDDWPDFSRTILIVLMFIGACAGSTGGGLKVSRVVLLMRTVKREFQHMLHPRSIGTVRFEGKPVDNMTLVSISTYFGLYMAIYAVLLLIVSLEPEFNFTSNFSAVAACYNNIGPGLSLVGPTQSYSGYSDLSKIVLAFSMLLGRLELYPILFIFTPSTWTKK